MKLSIIIPTIGRKTLARALDSITDTGMACQVVVVSDGADAERIVSESDCPAAPRRRKGDGWKTRYFYYRLPERHHHWGCAARTAGIEIATGTHLMFLDDDDWYREHALGDVAAVVEEYPDQPLMFRVEMPYLGQIIWGEPVVREGNVSSQMFVVPNDPDRLGRWTRRYKGDYDFIMSTLAKWPPDSLVWREEVIAVWGRRGPLPSPDPLPGPHVRLES